MNYPSLPLLRIIIKSKFIIINIYLNYLCLPQKKTIILTFVVIKNNQITHICVPKLPTFYRVTHVHVCASPPYLSAPYWYGVNSVIVGIISLTRFIYGIRLNLTEILYNTHVF